MQLQYKKPRFQVSSSQYNLYDKTKFIISMSANRNWKNLTNTQIRNKHMYFSTKSGRKQNYTKSTVKNNKIAQKIIERIKDD